jgi:hypothetical protein
MAGGKGRRGARKSEDRRTRQKMWAGNTHERTKSVQAPTPILAIKSLNPFDSKVGTFFLLVLNCCHTSLPKKQAVRGEMHRCQSHGLAKLKAPSQPPVEWALELLGDKRPQGQMCLI